MASSDPLVFGQTGIRRVADIATELGVEYRRPCAAGLGAELLLVAEHLSTTNVDQRKVFKVLRDIEKICNVHHQSPGNYFRLLAAIAEVQTGSSQYQNARNSIRNGLINYTSDARATAEAIRHLKAFSKIAEPNRRADNEATTTKRFMPAEDLGSVHDFVHGILQKQMRCNCPDGNVQRQRKTHLALLMLRPLIQSNPDQGPIQFEMLISSTPFFNDRSIGFWRHVHLIVPDVHRKKCVRFDDESRSDSSPQSTERLTQVKEGQFCELISSDEHSRLCLTIEDGRLLNSRPKLLERLVEHAPGISLAEILTQYRLSPRMKTALAYILAQSTWQYYNSDWMKTRWTSDTIQFFKERACTSAGERGGLFAWKPYLSVYFGEGEPESGEFSDVDGVIHRYPRIRCLGIMLVEIGIGYPLRTINRGPAAQSPAATTNADLLLAIEYSKYEPFWRDCDYDDYQTAVKHCLDPGIFELAPCFRGAGGSQDVEGLKQRREILYNKVVSPLEQLLQGTKWMEKLTTIGPLDTPVQRQPVDRPPPSDTAVDLTLPSTTSRKSLTKSQKAAKHWLSRMQKLNGELATAIPRAVCGRSSARIRIAVLDTGCDDGAPFFYNSDNAARIQGWKDWVDKSEQRKDCHGHGTHLVSLIMKIAPEAHVYVGRIAKNPDDLLSASEQVAQAISWASKEWQADIISMSFGYAEEQPCISNALRQALYERHDSILFFAAAANYGANEKEMFPARHGSVISVRGTNADGYFQDFNPPRNPNEEMVFGTLGSDVPSAWLSHQDHEEYKSGTSIATAIAAGIAAVLLEYVDGQWTRAACQDIKKKLRTCCGMQAMLRGLASPTPNEGYLYVAPWKLEDRYCKSDEVRWAKFVAAMSDIS